MIKINYKFLTPNTFNIHHSKIRKEKFAYWFTNVHVKPNGEHPTSLQTYQSSLKTIARLLDMSEEEFYAITSTSLLRAIRIDLLKFETFKALNDKSQEDLPSIYNTYILFNKWYVQTSFQDAA